MNLRKNLSASGDIEDLRAEIESLRQAVEALRAMMEIREDGSASWKIPEWRQ